MVASPFYLATPKFAIEDFLASEQQKGLLRFTTAGSVDDGKSTLIGRLLYDSHNVYEDQVKSVTKVSANRSAPAIDFALLTDGLRAEREQGITIDVAYRYFGTARRKFIIADTPGHEQYTRNMATGASTADLAIILIDARKGALPQSHRHAFIAALLGVPRFVVAVNKMDLVNYDEATFHAIEKNFRQFLNKLEIASVYFLPISALHGDNIVKPSKQMPWFKGPSLLEHLETVDIPIVSASGVFRFPVQRVVRPDDTFRGYAGQILAGSIHSGDPVCVLPAGYRTTVRSIVTFDGGLVVAHAPMSVTLTLSDEIDISRGDVISAAGSVPHAATRLEATVVWMHPDALELRKPYLIKHTTQTVKAEVRSIRYRVNVETLERERVKGLELNEIGIVEVETAHPLFFDTYAENRSTGGFIVIDPSSNLTVGAGMILRPLLAKPRWAVRSGESTGKVTPAERRARFGHAGAILSVGPRPTLAGLIERKLFDVGCSAVIAESESAAYILQSAGLIAILAAEGETLLPADDQTAATHLIGLLQQDGVLTGGMPEKEKV